MSPLSANTHALYRKARNKRMSVGSGFAFVVTLVLCSLLIYAAIRHQQRIQYMSMEKIIDDKADKIHKTIANLLYKNHILSTLVMHNHSETGWFDGIARLIMDDKSIMNVLLAPDGIVSEVYPLKGNERVVGYNLFGEGAGNREAVLSRDKDTLIFGGPFLSVQGSMTLVGRLPVWVTNSNGEKKFWGLTSITLHYPDALQNVELESLEESGFTYEIWRISPDTGERQIIAGNEHKNFPSDKYVEKHIQLYGADWYFRILNIRSWYQYIENWLIICTGIAICLLILIILNKKEELGRVKSDLELLVITDTLTGELNRMGLFHEAEKALHEENICCLSFIDLNYFKHINDRYGHKAGDLALREFARRVKKHARDRYIFARVGGDEFILVRLGRNKELSTKTVMKDFWEAIRREFCVPLFSQNGMDVYLSFSVGTAYYPDDASTVEDLISCADTRMYENKMERYKQERTRRRTDTIISQNPGPTLGKDQR